MEYWHFSLYFLNNSHNKREKARNAVLIVEMKGESTYLTNPEESEEEPKKFTFDFSYLSHDGFEEREDGYLAPSKPHYADQVLHEDDFFGDKINCILIN